MGILEKIADIEKEMSRTQKNKGTTLPLLHSIAGSNVGAVLKPVDNEVHLPVCLVRVPLHSRESVASACFVRVHSYVLALRTTINSNRVAPWCAEG